MRLRHTLIATLAVVTAATMLDAPSASAAAPATVVTVVRPVTVAGHVAPGYRAVNDRGDTVDCGAGTPSSPAAVTRNVLFCAPSAAVAIACWRAAWAHHVLCLRDARRHVVARLRVDGAIAGNTKPAATPWPLDILLGNGAYCGLRDGGAAAPLRGHPRYAPTYFCDNGAAVWARGSDPTTGVHRGRIWTVQTAPESGEKGVLVTRRVAHAWFVGTRYRAA